MSKAKRVAACVIACVLAAGALCAVGIGTDGFKDWSFSRWTQGAEPSGSIKDGAVVTDGESSGLRLMSARIAKADYEEYGIAGQAESATVLTATFTPEATTNKAVTWTCDDTSGKVTVTPVAGNPLQATVTVTGAFGQTVTITCTSQANPSVKATAKVEYVKSVTAVQNNYDVTSIKDDFEVGGYNSFGIGTLTPTSFSGNVTMTLDTDLYTYLKARHSGLVQSATLSQGTDEITAASGYNVNLLFGEIPQSEWESVYEDIALYYYGWEEEYMIIGTLSYDDVHCYYNGIETSYHEGSLVETDMIVNSFEDITVNPTGITLNIGTVIFGENGIVE